MAKSSHKHQSAAASLPPSHQFAAPDGGWGWIVVIANAVSNIVTMSIVTNFGLIFKDKLTILQMSATNMTIVINLSSTVNMSMGLFTGPTLKAFGFRKVAFASGAMFVGGVLATAFADSIPGFIVAYCVLAAAGNGLLTTSFSLALNTYFCEKRSKAAGLAMTLTGLGPIFYPPLITVLLAAYGVTGCVMLLAGISAHIFVAAAVLQPVKRHQRFLQVQSLCEIPFVESVVPTTKNGSSAVSSEDQYDYLEQRPTEEVHSLMMDPELKLSTNSLGTKNVSFRMPAVVIDDLEEDNRSNVSSAKRSACCVWLISQLDLDLLADKVFINIIIGMAIAAFSEINFSILTPFILSEMNYTNIEIASMMSALAIADIIARFVSPFLGDSLGWSPRVMYMAALTMLIVTRWSLLLVSSYTELILLAVFMGLAKGIRTVYMILVIPSHVSIEKLASASGIRMVSNGLVLILLGPLVGFLRDKTGNYVLCVYFMNVISAVCLAMWTFELVYTRMRTRVAVPN